MTVLSSLPFQSTSHAASSGSGSTGRLYVFAFDAVIFCCPIHKPPGASVITASALGYMPGDLNILVVFAVLVGAAPRPLPAAAVAPAAMPVGARVSARPAARNSLRFMLMASPLKGAEIPRERSAGVEADLIPHNRGPGGRDLLSFRLIGLVIMDLTFLAPRCHRHAYASARVGAAGGAVPAFFIGVDHVTIFATNHADAGDQRADIAVNIDPELHHVGVPVAPVGGGRQFREVRPDVQIGRGMAVIQEALTRTRRSAILVDIEERLVE